MFRNLSDIDRATRILIGFAAIMLVFVLNHLKIGLLGIIPILTGIIGVCPLYIPFRLKSYHPQASH